MSFDAFPNHKCIAVFRNLDQVLNPFLPGAHLAPLIRRANQDSRWSRVHVQMCLVRSHGDANSLLMVHHQEGVLQIVLVADPVKIVPVTRQKLLPEILPSGRAHVVRVRAGRRSGRHNALDSRSTRRWAMKKGGRGGSNAENCAFLSTRVRISAASDYDSEKSKPQSQIFLRTCTSKPHLGHFF